MFFEVETVLHLYETLVPRSIDRSAQDAWALISGYCVPEINNTSAERRQCLLLRTRLKYVRTSTAWQYWLNWYQRQPTSVRLYEFLRDSEGMLGFEQKHFEVELRHERLVTYERLFNGDNLSEQRAWAQPKWACAGNYDFSVNGTTFRVKISEAMAEFAKSPMPTRSLPTATARAPLVIHLNDLLITAREMDAIEAALKVRQPGYWYGRLSNLYFGLLDDDTACASTSISIEGLFHLVGKLGVGKSSLIWVMAYHLAQKNGQHVTVVVNTVVETVRQAAWLRQLGVFAAPALGRNRADHERKVGLANADAFDAEQVFKSQLPADPTLRWMPAPCALSGSTTLAIPVGSEPCHDLTGEDREVYRCPLIPVCPVHNVSRDLVSSQVWVVNSMSFLYSRAPEGIGEGDLYLFEAIYRLSDLVIIDEVDRVQVQWDQAFAPTRILAGHQKALLDQLHRQLGALSVGESGRRKASRAMFNRLTNTDDQANILSNRAFKSLAETPQLADWIERRQFTGRSLFGQLLRELVCSVAKMLTDAQLDSLRNELEDEFRRYWRDPLRRETGFLAQWISTLLATDTSERRLKRELSLWLVNTMGWRVPLSADQSLLVRKLDLCATLTAMLKRANDLFYQLIWAEGELDGLEVLDLRLPDALISLVPEPPLGSILGSRLVGHEAGRQLGVFNMMRYQGVGRWFLLNYPRLYADHRGIAGPHLLLISATSWLPGSTQFHIDALPQAMLLSRESDRAGRVELRFFPMRHHDRYIKVSGAGHNRERNLRSIVRMLATSGQRFPSVLEDELQFWAARGEKRALLLLVGSYEQTEWALDEFNRLPNWQRRVMRLLPDDADFQTEGVIRARQIEQLGNRNVDILIAPLLAIQRGFNILDDEQKALIGSAYFLVRPYPTPDDLSPQILSLNAWLLRHLQADGRTLTDTYAQFGLKSIGQLRRRAIGRWGRRLDTGTRGLAHLDADNYDEFLRDQFIVIWQTIGRLLRGGRDAHVFFVDAAFAPQMGKRHMLRDWYGMLRILLASPASKDAQLAAELYQAIYEAFDRAIQFKEIPS